MIDWIKRRICELAVRYSHETKLKTVDLSDFRQVDVMWSFDGNIYIAVDNKLSKKTFLELKINPDQSINYLKHEGVMIAGEEQ